MRFTRGERRVAAMAFLVVIALVVLGTFVIILPALLPGLLPIAVGVAVYRSVMRHRHPDQGMHTPQ